MVGASSSAVTVAILLLALIQLSAAWLGWGSQQEAVRHHHHHGYWNLSCPFEWSKYSCIHQGHDTIAKLSSHYEKKYPPLSPTALHKFLQRKVFLFGDSLLRQVFISAACQHHKHSRSQYIPWEKAWPCHGTVNCISGGPHSGFNEAAISWKEGGELHFYPLTTTYLKPMANNGTMQVSMESLLAWVDGTSSRAVEAYSSYCSLYGIYFRPMHGDSCYTLTEKDIFVFNLGIHHEIDQQQAVLTKFMKYAKKMADTSNAPKVMYYITPAQHFNHSVEQNGLFGEKSNNTMCLQEILSDPRADMERHMLLHETTTAINKTLAAVIDPADLKAAGVHHIGSADCSHYCMPGVPDVAAREIMRTAAGG